MRIIPRLALVVVSAPCTPGEGSGGTTVAVRDSVGILIAENRGEDRPLGIEAPER